MFNYGKRIVEIREKHSLSARTLAAALNASPSTLSRIESSGVPPTAQLLDQILEYFGMSYSDFFNDESNYKNISIDHEMQQEENFSYKTDENNLKITNDEYDIIIAYRKATIPEKTAINALLEQYKEKTEDLLEIKNA